MLSIQTYNNGNTTTETKSTLYKQISFKWQIYLMYYAINPKTNFAGTWLGKYLIFTPNLGKYAIHYAEYFPVKNEQLFDLF